MLMHMATPTRAKKRFGGLLRGLRLAAGMSAAEAAREVKSVETTISRYEAGEVKPVWGTVRVLLDCYKASPEQFAEVERLWDDANEEPPSIRLPSGTHRAFRKLVNNERDAARERTLSPYVFPALLQTERYARALLAAGHRLQGPRVRADSVVNARLRRQQLLEGPDPLVLHALIDEAVICRQVGGCGVLREQLAQLLVAGTRPNIILQVIPFAAGGYGTMNGSCTIVDYAEPDTVPGVYLEYPAGGAWVDNEDDVERFTTMYDDIVQLAHTPADSADLIHEQVRALGKT
jgi:transcriptional regulator with XRE-family HTH domain